MKITITQTDQNSSSPFAAAVQFDGGPRYPVTISDPFDAKAEAELQWYFEKWLTFPFTGQVRAQRVAASTRAYGEALFQQLFHGEALFEYKMGVRDGGLGQVQVEIRGTPAFHALHWESVWDPQQGQPLAVTSSFVRANDTPPPTQLRLRPSPTLNILLVVARPRGRQDVGYRTISRPLVEALHNSQLRANIDIVRPGTYRALVAHLETSRNQHGDGHYHIIHFDLHGSLLTYGQYQRYEKSHAAASHLVYKGYGRSEVEPYEGYKAFLSFNGEQEGESDLVLDDTIAKLLQNHQIPIAILNACQSGRQVGAQETSLGSRLVAAGVQAVLAMGYSVTVSAARLLMHHLYRHLLAGEPLPQAIRRARLELYNDKGRRAAYDQTIALEDWLLPVVYQNYEVVLPLTGFASQEAEAAYWQRQNQRFVATVPTYGFVGRDVDILTVEKRLLAEAEGVKGANVLLLQGMGGTGKTTLLRHLMQWWQTTRLVDQLFYFGYDEKGYTAAQIVDSVARQLEGAAYVALPEAAQRAKVVQRLCGERHLLVLDNVESVTGAALAIQHTLNGAEQADLRGLVAALAEGRTLVLLGSRGPEPWLVGEFSPLSSYELPGLDPEAASLLAERVLGRLGKGAYASHPDHREAFRQLLKLLDGHPLALEIVLANLARQTPAELLAAFTAGAEGVDAATGGDLWRDKTKSILRCVEYSHSNLSPAAQALLACLAPFTGVVNANWLTQYTNTLKAQPALAHLPYDQWGTVLQEALNWGLLTPHESGGGYVRLQPILPYFLRQRLADPAHAAARAAVEAAFRAHYDGVGGALAQLITSREPQQRQVGQALIGLEYENLMTALKLAFVQKAEFYEIYQALYEFLLLFQDHSRRLALCQLVVAEQTTYSDIQLAGRIGVDFYLVQARLGRTYLDLQKYNLSSKTYEESLETIARLKSAPDKEIGHFRSVTYHQLGAVAQAQRDWETAVAHYQQALAIYIEYNDRYRQASTYHQLGRVAEEQRDWETAVAHYQQALAIFIEFKDGYNQGKVHHQLGRVAEAQRDWQTAVAHYQQALAIKIEYNDRYSQASTYHQLGMVAQEQRDWQTAVAHYQQALAIDIEYNDRYSQASTYGQLGLLAETQEQWAEAANHLLQAMTIFVQFGDSHSGGIALRGLARVWKASGDGGIVGRLAAVLGVSVAEAAARLSQAAG